MIPKATFVQNLALCSDYKHLQGDFVECGVWRGGMSAAIAEILGKDRLVHLYDSFMGLPEAKEIDGPAALSWQRDTSSSNFYNNCCAEECFVEQAMSLACHSNYVLHKGWFKETLLEQLPERIAILHLDADWYDSTMTCLRYLFPKVIDQGIIIIDDYGTWDGCAKAVHEYLSSINQVNRILQRNNRVTYIRKHK
jgi:hypothetical protein